MKIKNGFTLHQIGDEHIIMHNGTGNVDFSNIISLNPTATRLWQHVEGTDFNTDTLTDFLTENYEVDAETAKRDAEQLIKNWLEAGIRIAYASYFPNLGTFRIMEHPRRPNPVQ